MPMTIVICEDCGQKNRVPETVHAGTMAVCGRCKEPLNDDDVDDEDDADEEQDREEL